ncbi:MAG: hypothetical protein KKD69_06490 [Euryarchaeota archaeon]|nr:hypothetical protein [Euryarchaeota archaeon]
MKKLICFVIVLFLAAPCFAKDVWVNGYYKSNGTYVEGYHRSSPDRDTQNNYSTQGNYNPYTGEKGTKKPSEPDLYNPSFGQKNYNNNFISQPQGSDSGSWNPLFERDNSWKKK